MYQYILFDLDGTLTDSAIGIINGIAYAKSKFNLPMESKEELKKYMGPPLKTSFIDFCGLSDEKAEEAVKIYREYYSEKGLFENAVYEGIEELLQELKEQGKILIVATSKPEKFSKQILEHFNLMQYFDVVVGATMDGSRGTKIEVMEHAIKEAKITNMSEAIMIGDRKFDILGAKHFRMDSIGVLFGYGSREELEEAGATYIVEKALDIKSIV